MGREPLEIAKARSCRPPVLLYEVDYVYKGPYCGTIHKSNGRSWSLVLGTLAFGRLFDNTARIPIGLGVSSHESPYK